mmetsp:Transcript_46285/g.112161  ORF Transcript_46285/g.112161 Transcript_46285/m.112161 type:complete len:827 (+) Transcript_46285:44-2524(+)
MKISGVLVFKNPLRKGRKSDAFTRENAKACFETLEPTLSDDEDDEPSIAAFSLSPCTTSTRGDTTGTRGFLPLRNGHDSPDSFLFMDDDTAVRERSLPPRKADMLRNMKDKMDIESQRTCRTATSVDEEQKDDEICCEPHHFRLPFPQIENAEEEQQVHMQAVRPKSNTSLPKSPRSSSKSPKTRKLKKVKKFEANDLSLNSSGKLKKKKKKSLSSAAMREESSNKDPTRKGKNQKGKRTSSLGASAVSVELPQSSRSLDVGSHPRAKTTKTKSNKLKQRRSSVGSFPVELPQSFRSLDVGSSSTAKTTKPKRNKVKKRRSSAGSKGQLKRRSSVESTGTNNASLSHNSNHTSESRQSKKRINVPHYTDEASDSHNSSLSTKSRANASREPEKRISAPSDKGPGSKLMVPLADVLPVPTSRPPENMTTTTTTTTGSSSNPSASSGNGTAYERSQPPTTYSKNNPTPAEVKQPDYSLDLTHVFEVATCGANSQSEEQDTSQEMIQSPRLTLEERRRRKQATLSKLVNKLTDYESKLEKERLEVPNSSIAFHCKGEEKESKEGHLLKEEIKLKEELQSQVQQLRQQLETANGKGRELEEVKKKMQKLERENTHLQQENEHHEEIIYSLRLGQKEIRRQLMSNAKAQGEVLLLRSTLTNKTSALEELSRELARAEEELVALREDTGVAFMQKQVETLENVKKVLAAEVERLQQELQQTKQELHAATTDSTSVPNSAKEASWFSKSFRSVGSVNNKSVVGETPGDAIIINKSTIDDIVNDLNGKNNVHWNHRHHDYHHHREMDIIDMIDNTSDRPEFLERAKRIGVLLDD